MSPRASASGLGGRAALRGRRVEPHTRPGPSLTLGVTFLLLFATSARTALVCYVESCLPLVERFGADGAGRLRAFLGGRTLIFNGEQWREGPRGKPPKRMPCRTMSVCTRTSEFTYVGLGFSGDEGMRGRGGLVRIDRHTGRSEMRRLKMLDDVSINAIAAEGDTVWFGTTTHGECEGQPPARGLAQYDWRTRKLTRLRGVAGFVMHDIVVTREAVWVATDLGISRLDRASATWRHWLPESRGATELTAEAIYRRLLRTLPDKLLHPEDPMSCREQLREALRHRRQ